jgi:hypothetical protein
MENKEKNQPRISNQDENVKEKKELSKTNINQNSPKIMDKNSIIHIINYTKSYVHQYVKNKNDLENFLNALKGANFDINTLIEIIKEADFEE